jgi:small GTP-binding protein
MSESIQLRKKVCLLGDAAVGKTSVIRRFVFNQFEEKYITTIGTNVSKKDLKLVLQDQNSVNQNYDMTLAIWDIIGQRELQSFNLNYFRNANGGIVICDITRRDTLDSLMMWTSSFFNTIGEVPLVFLINKFDLAQQAEFQVDELGQIAAQFNAPFFTTSALTGENVEHAFYALSERMIRLGQGAQGGQQNTASKVASELIVEFSNNIGGIERGIPLIKEIFKIAGVDFLNPQKEQLQKALPDLVQLLRDLQGAEVANRASQKFNAIMAKLQ